MLAEKFVGKANRICPLSSSADNVTQSYFRRYGIAQNFCQTASFETFEKLCESKIRISLRLLPELKEN